MKPLWTEQKSMHLSRILTIVFAAVVAAADLGGWWLVEFICKNILIDHGTVGRITLLLALYLCSAPAYVALACLYRLLKNIGTDRVFIAENVVYLHRISLCCALVAVIGLMASPVWYSLILIAAAAAFMGLIVRVVKNVFVRAIGMKDELDYTV